MLENIYADPQVAQQRADEIEVLDGDDKDGQSLGKLCCDTKYRRATLVGCTISIFSQLTGINVIMFYSNMVFKGLDMSNTTVTALIGIINFLTSIVGLVFLAYFGRKLIMAVFNALMALTLLLLSYFAFIHDTTGMVVCVLLFISFFEFSSGPIVWLYMAEIMKDKAIALATFLNWSISLLISISIPLLVKQIHIGFIFLALGLFTVIGTFFIILFMKETRGKSQAEIDKMFSDEIGGEDSAMKQD